jgi:ketosteroid isomerase-like protein
MMIGTLGKVILTKPDEIFQYLNLNNNKRRTARLTSSEALAVDDSTVVITGFDSITGVKDGQPINSLGRVTFVLSKRGADWKIVHLHR